MEIYHEKTDEAVLVLHCYDTKSAMDLVEPDYARAFIWQDLV
jgi:phage-related protein